MTLVELVRWYFTRQRRRAEIVRLTRIRNAARSVH